MAQRDNIWKEVLKLLARKGQFRISELPCAESQRHTIRRVLREMEVLGYVTRESNRSATWRVSEEAMLVLAVDAESASRREQ